MVDLCLVIKWSGILKTGLLKACYVVQNVWYSNGPPSHVTLTFEYRTPILSDIQMNPVFRCLVFRWLLYMQKLQMLTTCMNLQTFH